VADARLIKESGKELQRLMQERSQAEQTGDNDQYNRLEAAIKALSKSLKSMINNRGQSRDLNNPADKMRPRIQGTLGTACQKLRKAACVQLAEHFKNSISSETDSFVYRPGTPCPAWRKSKQ
jgi:hypothetical protein